MSFMESVRAMFPEGYPGAIVWVALALLLLVVVLFLIRLLRRFGSGTFVAGGRNRRTRLAVMDATAIDSRRRLVLVRRDDVEHLLLIGGPTDVVVEQDIRLMPRTARQNEQPDQPAPKAGPTQAEIDRARAQIRPPQPPARPAEPPRPVEPPPSRSIPVAAPHAVLPRPAMPMSAPPQPPAAASATRPADTPAAPRNFEYPKPGTAASRQPAKDLDSALLHELETSLDRKPGAPGKPDASLDEQMNKLLGEISRKN